MQFPCEIDNIKTLKKGMKITLAVEQENVKNVMKHIYNFMDKPIYVAINIDEKKQRERLNQITPEQRKKIYSIFKDIANSTGNNKDLVKDITKGMYSEEKEVESFSLSDCKKETASDFIEWLIEFCFENGIELRESPKEAIDDIEKYVNMCIKNKICAVCGAVAEIHHVDSIGMGRDRKKHDDTEHKKIALCRKHHSEAHQIGWETFKRKYHVEGV